MGCEKREAFDGDGLIPGVLKSPQEGEWVGLHEFRERLHVGQCDE